MASNAEARINVVAAADTTDLERLTSEVERASAETKEFGRAAGAASADLIAAKRGLDEQREALARLRLDYRTGKVDAEAFKTQELALQGAILDARSAVRAKTETMQAASAGVRTAAAAEARLAEQLRATTAATRQQGEAARTLGGELQGVGQQLQTIQRLAAATIGGTLLAGQVGEIAKTADAYANLAARIQLAAGDGEAFKASFEGVFAIAQRTGSAVETVGGLFTKLATAGKQLGITNQQTLALVETITQATQLSGVSAESASAALVQLSQAMASGVLRGEELNSILEQAPRLARALADGLGVTTGELRKLGEAGALTAQQVIGALQGQGAALRAEFEQLPPTIGRAITNLSTAWTQYVGEVDKASGASAAIAGAINSLSKNLDSVAATLYSVGKAAAAFQALKLAQTMLGIGTAARAATAEVTALAAAQNASATAGAGAAAGASRFAAAISSVKAFALVGVVTNLKEIGTAIGEGIAKWQGYGKVLADAEGRMRAEEAATRAAAERKAALAQQMQIAADKALGLGKESQALIGVFEKAREAGDTTAEAIGKVGKALELGDTEGIRAAIAALDALEVRGKITGVQLREALGGALKGIDLGKFETEARAAFDSGEIGARRFAAAVDALGEESLRRAGLSAQELKTGFGAAAASAINDVDALVKTLDRLGAKGPETAQALAKALDHATGAASTERALRAVIARYEDLGKAGRLSGEQVAAGLDAAKAKIDALVPGVTTLDEALRNFGLKTGAEMQATATKFAASWESIRNSTVVALDDKVEAFEKFAAAAIAANKGVETSEIALQREILRTQQITQQGLRTPNGAPLQSQRNGSTGTQRTQSGDNFNQAAQNRKDGYSDQNVFKIDHNEGRGQSVLGNSREERLAGQNAVDARLQFEIRKKLVDCSLAAADLPEIQAVVESLRQQAAVNNSASKLSAGFQSTAGLADAAAWQAVRGQLEDFVKRATRPAPAAGDDRAPVSTTHAVTISLNGKPHAINTASSQDSEALVGMLGELERHAGRTA